MSSTGILRARLSVDREEPDQVKCRFLSPEQSAEEVCALGQPDTEYETAISSYRSDLELLAEMGTPPIPWLLMHREKRKLAAEALARIGLPQPIADQLTQLQEQIGSDTLLLEFSTNSLELDCLPWELLGSQELGRQADSNLVVWRYVAQESRPPWPQNKVMLAAASPPEQRISPNVDGEFTDIKTLVEQSGRLDVRVVKEIQHSTNPLFTAALVDKQPNVLHVSMHGDQTSMYFEREDPREQDLFNAEPANRPFSRQRVVPYGYLAGVIADIGSVVTAILSVCFSAYGDGAETSFAHKLITEGIPSAIGMVYNVTPVVSREFCRELYRGICNGEPIADSYASAIISLRRMSSYDECLWSVPMLYGSNNVIPLPTDDYKRFLSDVGQAMKSIEELRRNLARLLLHSGSQPDNWRVDSTRAAMGLGIVQRGLRYLRDNAVPTRVDSYLWRLQFDASYKEVERKISLVRDSMTELSQAAGSAAFSRGSQRFRSASQRLMPELDNISKLVFNEFPALQHHSAAR
jgi:CHAT domain